jgi:hypothetical protein
MEGFESRPLSYPVKREVLRWAFGSPNGPCSSIWRLWGSPKGDIHVALRCLGSKIKASFHRDGKCHIGFTHEYAATAAARFGKKARHWETWKLSSDHVTWIFKIEVPWSELRSAQLHEDGKVVWLAPPPPGLVGIISILLAPSPIELGAPAGAPTDSLVGTVRTNVRSAWVFYGHSTIGAGLALTIATERAKLGSSPGIGTRAALCNVRIGQGSDVQVLELAHDPPSVAKSRATY